jgi:putative flippase GtrA
MTLDSSKISEAAWRLVPGALQRSLRTTVARRFVRFLPAAVAAVCASQITYIVCIGPAGLTAGISGAAGWIAGAAVSYVISRWAWERRGRPDLLKETLPFWMVSIGAGVVLVLASKLGAQVAHSLGMTGVGRVAVADGFYFTANCATFVARFLIFHYVLFVDRGSRAASEPLAEASPSGGAAPFAMAPGAVADVGLAADRRVAAGEALAAESARPGGAADPSPRR